MPMTTTKQWKLSRKPYGDPILSGEGQTFELTTLSLPPLQDGQILWKTLYLSNDPAQRSWISPMADASRLYITPLEPGDVMLAGGIGEVLESRNSNLPVGSVVSGRAGWSEYAVLDSKDVALLNPPEGLRPTHFLGALGMPGFTAYYGLTQVVKAKSSDVVVVSAAAGAVGSMVVQIAKKVLGCKKVIGFAGTDEKCRWVERLGADLCLNYKSSNFPSDLASATEGFVDVFFGMLGSPTGFEHILNVKMRADSVGGEILDLMLKRMGKFGRIAACGTTSNYNKDSNLTGLKNFLDVVMMRIQISGFLIFDWIDHRGEVTDLLVDEWKKGNLLIEDENETIVPTRFEDIPKTWNMLFTGGNKGKLLTQLVGP